MSGRNRNSNVLNEQQAALLEEAGVDQEEASKLLEDIREAAKDGEFADGKAMIGDRVVFCYS